MAGNTKQVFWVANMYQIENSGDLLKNKRQQVGNRRNWQLVGTTVLLLGLTSLLTDISSEMVSTTLPLYLLVTLQFTPFQIGLIDGLNQGAAVLVKLVSGMIADRWQRPKEVATAGYLFSMLSKLGFLLIGSNWTGISSVVVLDRIGKGIRTAPRDAMIAASSAPERIATAFGVHRAMDTAGAMLGPLLAVAILTIAPGAYDAVFVVSMCVALVGVAVIATFVHNPAAKPEATESRAQDSAASRVSYRSTLSLLAIPQFRSLVIIGSLFALVTVSDGLLYLNLQRSLALRTGFFPLLFVVSALLYMLLAIPVGSLADRIGSKKVFLVGYAMLAVAYALLLLPSQNYLTAGCVLLLIALYYSGTDGVLMALASRALPTPLRTTGLALLTTGTGLARLFASTLYGVVWNQFGANQALMIFIIGLVSSIVIATFVISEIDTKGIKRVNHD